MSLADALRDPDTTHLSIDVGAGDVVDERVAALTKLECLTLKGIGSAFVVPPLP